MVLQLLLLVQCAPNPTCQARRLAKSGRRWGKEETSMFFCGSFFGSIAGGSVVSLPPLSFCGHPTFFARLVTGRTWTSSGVYTTSSFSPSSYSTWSFPSGHCGVKGIECTEARHHLLFSWRQCLCTTLRACETGRGLASQSQEPLKTVLQECFDTAIERDNASYVYLWCWSSAVWHPHSRRRSAHGWNVLSSPSSWVLEFQTRNKRL